MNRKEKVETELNQKRERIRSFLLKNFDLIMLKSKYYFIKHKHNQFLVERMDERIFI